MITVAIVGSPNVGKSTLFNKLVRRRSAITYNRPGVTRDYKEELIELGDNCYRIIDTGGWSEDAKDLDLCVVNKVKEVFAESDLVLFVVDNYLLGPREFLLANWLRKNRDQQTIVLLVNKCESVIEYNSELDFFDKTLYISAEHNLGLSSIYKELMNCKPKTQDTFKGSDATIAILGQPNAGKSTLINKLVGYDRVITSDKPGTTRDAITVKIKFGDQVLELIDTAGMRKRAKVANVLEKFMVNDAMFAIRKADVVCLLVDGLCPVERQDKSIVNLAHRYNKPVIVVINKWDLIPRNKQGLVLQQVHSIYSKVYGYGVVVISVSALYDSDFARLMDCCLDIASDCRSSFNTSSLNRWLASAVLNHSPPLSSTNKAVKLKYIHQSSSNPIILKVEVNVTEISASYKAYLANDFRKYFKLAAVPVVIKFRKIHNPYLATTA